MPLDISHPLIPLLLEIEKGDGEPARLIKNYLPKVRGVLEGYAVEVKKASLNKLTLLDVLADIDGKPELQGGLIDHIDGLITPKDKGPVKSQIKGLLKAVFKSAGFSKEEGLAVEPGFIRASLPEWLREVYDHLPKNGGNLSPRSCHALGVMLYVVASQKPSSVRSLLVDMADHVSAAVRTCYESPAWKALDVAISHLRIKLKLSKSRCREKSLPFKQWPPTFRKQWEEFDLLAIAGPTKSLQATAKRYKVRVKPLIRSSLDTYQDVVGRALGAIQWHDDLELKDLLKIGWVEVAEGGAAKRRRGNEFIEDYRRQQQDPQTWGKAAGQDSVAFVSLASALKTMAAYFGLFELRQKFHAVYKPKPDEETRARRREEKKAAYSQDFVDGQIARLAERFDKIVETGAFKTDPKSLRLCIFLVVFVTMRYMGFRQQAVRNCIIDVHIKFGARGESVTFEWPKELVKTKRPIRIKLERRIDKTHELLIDVLTKYKGHVYPHVVEKQDESLGGQFFVKPNHRGKFVGFRTHTNLYQWFSNASLEFLPLKDKIEGRKEGMHPHFLRGFAIDWLLGYGLSAAEVGDLMNISQKTVLEIYASKERPVNTRSALNSLQVKRLEHEALADDSSRVNLVAEVLAARVREVLEEAEEGRGSRARGGARGRRRGRRPKRKAGAAGENRPELGAEVASPMSEVTVLTEENEKLRRQNTPETQLPLDFD